MIGKELEPPDLPDLDDMDEAEQKREVYAWAGLALYFAQVFEQSMIHASYVAQIADGTLAAKFASADDFHALVDRQTAGTLIHRVFKHTAISLEAAELCAECVVKRNFLAHQFFVERSDLLFHQEGRRLMLEELRSVIGAFQQADAELEAAMFKHGEGINFTPELVRKLYEATRAEAHPGGRPPHEIIEEIIRRERPEWPPSTVVPG